MPWWQQTSPRPDDPNQIVIKLTTKGNLFTFHICNTTEHVHVVPSSNHGGIGLVNLKRRLELLYPGKHEFTSEHVDGYYKADLKIEME